MSREHSTLKLSYSSLGSPGYDIDGLIELAVRSGYDAVELRAVSGEIDLAKVPDLAPRNLAATRRRFEKAALAVSCLDSSVRMTSLDAAERAAQLASARDYAAIAEGLGAPFVRVFGGDVPAGQDPDVTHRAVVDGLSEVAEATDELGVRSLIETHDAFSTAQSVRALFDEGVSDKLGVLWDTYHTYWHGETAHTSWELIGGLVHHVHLKDSADVTPGGTFEPVLTGRGVVPIKGILKVLHDVGYDGYVSFEWEKLWFPSIPGPEVAIPQFARYVAEIETVV